MPTSRGLAAMRLSIGARRHRELLADQSGAVTKRRRHGPHAATRAAYARHLAHPQLAAVARGNVRPTGPAPRSGPRRRGCRPRCGAGTEKDHRPLRSGDHDAQAVAVRLQPHRVEFTFRVYARDRSQPRLAAGDLERRSVPSSRSLKKRRSGQVVQLLGRHRTLAYPLRRSPKSECQPSVVSYLVVAYLTLIICW